MARMRTASAIGAIQVLPLLVAAAALIGFGAASAAPAPSEAVLASVADVLLPGRTTRLDYESLDPGRHLLFIAHLGDSTVIVFDTKEQRVLTEVPAISQVHGLLAIPELGRVYASATGTNEVVAIDEETLKVISRAPGGVYPDGMAYVPEAHKLYVSDEHGDTETVIDVRTDVRVATIPLGGDVGNTQYDPVTKHIFVNVQTRKQLIEIDPVTDLVIARIDLPGAESNHGLLIEPKLRRAFIACEENHKLLVLDLETRRVNGVFDVGEDPDVLGYDSELGYLYVAAESGIVSIFKTGDGPIAKLADLNVGANAHVIAVDSATHKSYFPLKNVGGRAVLRIMRPSPQPGS